LARPPHGFGTLYVGQGFRDGSAETALLQALQTEDCGIQMLQFFAQLLQAPGDVHNYDPLKTN
jgi:hypothetical protein